MIVIIFSQTFGDREFSFLPDIQRCKIFFLALYAMRDIFWGAGIFFPRYFLEKFVSLAISLQNVFFFFLKPPIPPSKVKWFAINMICVLAFSCNRRIVIHPGNRGIFSGMVF